jgi:hypothetical protein
VKQLISPILMVSMAIAATCACSAHDGETTAPSGTDGTASESGAGARDDRMYVGPFPKEWASIDWSCNAPEGAKFHPIVFVSPNGDDDAPGTANAPVLTIARALRLAEQRGHSVYVCP